MSNRPKKKILKQSTVCDYARRESTLCRMTEEDVSPFST